ncbi:protein SPIRAL1-like 5 [Chenopodium quinoa]|uniref:protein SPIRAL1-like 5 n=1 Tax=Chenopodium quinoa TaxID=63459 RepID=UPI000B790243|nr:protein SPIRAL1-like 5 [Chenopodium quinoa]
MSRGESYGGGQSSLGYLFGSKEGQPANNPPPSPSKAINPPYGTDIEEENSSPQKVDNTNNNYHRAQGPNSGNFITDRPSTKVTSVPGGSSSLGYLFGDK